MLLSEYTVVVVDDQPAIRFLVSEVLSQEGCQVYEASNTGQALRLLHEKSPDLMLLDVNIPGQTGIELLQEMRQQGDQTPVILMTGLDSISEAEIKRLKASVLEKPFDVRELQLKVHQQIRKSLEV